MKNIVSWHITNTILGMLRIMKDEARYGGTPITPAVGSQRQEDERFKASLSHIVAPSQKKEGKKKQKQGLGT
jgi:hypothetical protein